jgi:hypothetical protein
VRALLVIALMFALYPFAAAIAQTSPDQPSSDKTEITKAVKQETCPRDSEFFKSFDAFYNPASGRVEDNVTLQGERKALFLFRKCMAEKGCLLSKIYRASAFWRAGVELGLKAKK